MSGGTDQPSAQGRAGKLVDALRLGRAGKGGPGAVRSGEVEALLPEGHRARLVWDYVGGQDLSRFAAPAESGVKHAPAPEVLLALWLYAALKDVGSARLLADLCQTHPAYRWLCGGVPVDARSLAEFRLGGGEALDQVLAENAAGLIVAGLVGRSRGACGDTARADDALLACLAETRQRIGELRKRVDDEPGESARRRQAALQRSRSARAGKVAAAHAALTSLRTVAERQRQEEEAARARKAEAEARAKAEAEAKARAVALADAEKQRAAGLATGQTPTGVAGKAGGIAASARPRRRVPVGGFDPALPWSIDPAEQRRFRRIAGVSLATFVLVAALLALVEPPPVERAEAEKLPPRLAKLILAQKEAPKKPAPVPEARKEPEKKAETPEEPKEESFEPKPEAPKREAAKDPAKPKPSDEEVRNARQVASKAGLLIMRDQLAKLRELGGASLRQGQGGEGAERELITAKSGSGSGGVVERDLIASSATTGSGGLSARAVAHGGGGALQERATTKVAAPSGKPTIAEARAEAKGSKRTHEEIKLAFDANKAAIYGIYRRALRENPLLEGRVVVKLTIDAGGQVTACSIVSSALKDPELEAKLVARIQLINFGTRARLEPWTGSYHIDFVPAG